MGYLLNVAGRVRWRSTKRLLVAFNFHRSEVDLHANVGTAPRRTSGAEIRALVTALGDITTMLRDADPADKADKAEIYRELGLRLHYQPETQTVRAAVDLSAHRGVMVCVRGSTQTNSQRGPHLSETIRLA